MRGPSAASLALILLAAACGDAAVDWSAFPSADRVVAVQLDVTEVDVGTRFTVTVDRVQPADETAIEFDAAWLAPLALGEPTRAERTTNGRRQERLVFPAYATTPGELSLPREVTVGGEPELQSLVVRSVLSPDDDGTLEPPPLPGKASPTWWPWLVGVALVGAVVVALRRRRTPTVEVESTPTVVEEAPPPAEVLAESLGCLDPTAADFHERLAGALRDYLGTVCGTSAETATDEELLRGADALPVGQAETITDLLRECRMVRFGGARVTPPPGAPALDRAKSLLGSGGAR